MVKLQTEIQFPRKIIKGSGSLNKLTTAAEMLNINHLFVVLSKRSKESINLGLSPELKVDFFTDFIGEPTVNHLNKAIEAFKDSGAQAVVGLGGGSAIDLAKAVAVLAKNEQLTIQDLHKQKHLKRYPLIAIPTTAGTGSEVTKITVITDPVTSRKYNPGHESLIPDLAILDPKLTTSMPKEVTAYTGIDALTHAMEAYVSTAATSFSDLFAKEAMYLIGQNIENVYHDPNNIEARKGMLQGSTLAGIAFSNASTNLAHATARPLGVRFNLPHGLSVALTLGPVIEFSYLFAKERYEDVANLLGKNSATEYVNHLKKEFKIIDQAKKLVSSEELLKAIPKLTEDALSGNGIQTNVKIPTEEED